MPLPVGACLQINAGQELSLGEGIQDWRSRRQHCSPEGIQYLQTLITELQHLVPSLSLKILLTLESIEEILLGNFGGFSAQLNGDFYTIYAKLQPQIKQLSKVLELLSCPNVEETTIILRNLRALQQWLLDEKSYTERALFLLLEAHPNQTAECLKSAMKLMRPKSPEVKLPFISSSNFETLGIKRWLDDEIVNYFVTKWCSKSPTTLGLNTFFACKFIFQNNLCIGAKNKVLTSEDKRRAQRWCRAAEKTQGLSHWDRVFVPINENNSHWYSACINFTSKRIDIYDSLLETGINNRWKPVQSRKNTNTMLVLMQLTEVLSCMRGDEIQLENNPTTEWRFDPHTEVKLNVPCQPNHYDCGVHTLWHLQHVIEFGSVQGSCKLPHLRFSDNMIGQRLRLAQEVLNACGF